jgi:ABC-2 type transport system permease protein
MLPTWILMLVLLVGFIILPAQVAEEKEKKLLLGLLQTPIREVEWLFAKVCLGMILIGVAALFLHLLTKFDFAPGGGLNYLAFLMAGGFCSAPSESSSALCGPASENIGSRFYLTPSPFRALRFFENIDQHGAVAPLLPILPAHQIDPSGWDRRLRFSSGIDLSFRGWTLHLFLILSVNEKKVADVTGSYPDRCRRFA